MIEDQIESRMPRTAHIVLITGKRQLGKSTLCRHLTQALEAEGLQVRGLLTRTVGAHELEAEELPSHRVHRLTYPFDSEAGIGLTHFRINPEAMLRSSQALEAAFPTEIFVLDELGPLELKLGQGWVRVLTLLQEQAFCVAFIVVRPTLLAEAIHQLPTALYTVVEVTKESRDTLPQTLVHMALEICR